ncbi:PH domain-containing protein [Euzebya sp.]|uniref:PH domain-containing protein n=1 Tax=Euzebya sp. TaxID=1971409 RepID=UPI003512D9F3
MRTSPPADTDLRPLDPRVRTVWWISGAISAGIVVIAAVVVALLVPSPGGWIAGGIALVAVVSAALVPPLRYSRWRYAVRDDDIWVRQGIVWRTTTVVPFSRLQFVDTSQGPFDRWLGLASLVLHTAAVGSETTIPGLAEGEAEQLRERLADVDPDVVSI